MRGKKQECDARCLVRQARRQFYGPSRNTGGKFWSHTGNVPDTRVPAAAQAAGFNPEKQFTITQIEPDAVKEEVRLTFSQPLPLDVIRYKLKLVPPVKINWENSTVSEEGVLDPERGIQIRFPLFYQLPGYLHL